MGMADIEEPSVIGTPGAHDYQQYFFHSHNCISSNFSPIFLFSVGGAPGRHVDQHWAGFGFRSMAVSILRRFHSSSATTNFATNVGDCHWHCGNFYIVCVTFWYNEERLTIIHCLDTKLKSLNCNRFTPARMMKYIWKWVNLICQETTIFGFLLTKWVEVKWASNKPTDSRYSRASILSYQVR